MRFNDNMYIGIIKLPACVGQALGNDVNGEFNSVGVQIHVHSLSLTKMIRAVPFPQGVSCTPSILL